MSKSSSALDQYKRQGMLLGFFSTILGSTIFAITFIAKYKFENDYSLVYLVAIFAFGLGMVFSFVPSIIGGYLLAHWIYHYPVIEKHHSILRGAIIGAACMFAEDTLLGILSLPMSHGPSIEMFMFYVISSVIIASTMGLITGIRLTAILPKYKLQEK